MRENDAELPTPETLEQIVRGTHEETRAIGALVLFRFNPHRSWQEQSGDEYETEVAALVDRAKELLPSLYEMIACQSWHDRLMAAHLILTSAIEYRIDRHRLKNPMVRSGYQKELRKHLENITSAADFLSTKNSDFLSMDAITVFNFSRLRSKLELPDDEYLVETEKFAGYSPFFAALPLRFAACVLDIMLQSAEVEDRSAKRHSPKTDFAYNCLAAFQSNLKNQVSSSPNSPFLDFLAIAFEIATGNPDQSLAGAARQAWKMTADDPLRLHFAVREILEAEGFIDELPDEEPIADDGKDGKHRKHAELVERAVQSRPMTMLERWTHQTGLLNMLLDIEKPTEREQKMIKNLRAMIERHPPENRE